MPRDASNKQSKRGVIAAVLWLVTISVSLVAEPVVCAESVFAVVGDVTITHQEYDEAFSMAARQKFYHGKPPETQVALLQREVGNSLVNNILLAKEARRRGIQPDAVHVKKTLDAYEQRYQGKEQWEKTRAQALPRLQRKLEQDSILERLERSVRELPAPSKKSVQTYYAANPEKFTEPERLRLSVILLRVDPSSPKAKWDAARTEAQSVVKRLRAGAKFADLAKLHSGDDSAKNGGDMGHVHRGMLPDVAQQAVDKLKLKEISDPVTLLEGVAIFRVDDRKAAKLNEFTQVQERAQQLLVREQSEVAWKELIERLRRETTMKIDESGYLPLAVAASGTATSAK